MVTSDVPISSRKILLPFRLLAIPFQGFHGTLISLTTAKRYRMKSQTCHAPVAFFNNDVMAVTYGSAPPCDSHGQL
jgi:hypothetical protein